MTAPSHLGPVLKRASRRTVLAGALAAIGASVARAVTLPTRVSAADDFVNIQTGGSYDVTVTTTLTNQANANRVLSVVSQDGGGGGLQGAGVALTGTSQSSVGVEGFSESGNAIVGHSTSGAGVLGGSAETTGVSGVCNGAGGVGVSGYAGGSDGTGVRGDGTIGVFGSGPLGTGVHGETQTGRGVSGVAAGGIGLYGESETGFALRASGRARFDRVSGVATIATGETSVLVTPEVALTGSSFVLLTPKANLGGRDLWFTTNSTADTFTIRMSSSRSSATKVAWLLLG